MLLATVALVDYSALWLCADGIKTIENPLPQWVALGVVAVGGSGSGSVALASRRYSKILDG